MQTVPVALQMSSRWNSAETPTTVALVMVTCVEVSPAVVALVCVSIQGKMNAKYLLEGV